MIYAAASNMLVISAVCTVIILMLLALKKVWDKYLNVNLRIILRTLILIRLCVPYMAETPIGVLNKLSPNYTYSVPVNAESHVQEHGEISQSGAQQAEIAAEPGETAKIPSAGYTRNILKWKILGWVYAAGFALCLILLIGKFLIAILHINNLAECKIKGTIDAIETLKNELNIRRNVIVLIDENAVVPMVYGIFKIYIIIPEVDQNKDISELKLIFLHELIHCKCFDIIKLWILEMAICFNWFNPAMYLLKNTIIQDLEIACDQKVLSHEENISPYEYGMIIAKYSTGKKNVMLSAHTGLALGRHRQLKARLKSISSLGQNKTKIAGVIIALCVLLTMIACTSVETDINKRLPESFDWRNDNIVSSPQNQGEYSTGAVFATMGIFESYIARTTGEGADLSEQQFIDCTDYLDANAGVSPELVLDFAKEQGMVKEDVIPYTGVKNSVLPERFNENKRYYVPSWSSVLLAGNSQKEQVEIVKKSILKYGPVMTNIGFYEGMADYSGGIYQSEASDDAMYGHWVNIVGWQDDQNIQGGGCWIVKESWGTEWGEDGYIKIPFNDSCGINDYILYYIEDFT